CYFCAVAKDGGERRARGISELRGQESTPWTHKSFIYKQGLISQAGRRGFESRLLLHLQPVNPEALPVKNPPNGSRVPDMEVGDASWQPVRAKDRSPVRQHWAMAEVRSAPERGERGCSCRNWPPRWHLTPRSGA